MTSCGVLVICLSSCGCNAFCVKCCYSIHVKASDIKSVSSASPRRKVFSTQPAKKLRKINTVIPALQNHTYSARCIALHIRLLSKEVKIQHLSVLRTSYPEAVATSRLPGSCKMNVEAVISQDGQSPNCKRDAPKGLKMGYSFYVYVYVHHNYIYIYTYAFMHISISYNYIYCSICIRIYK